MPDGAFAGNLYHHLTDYIGETVTIFTTSGGQSGAGFTGVVLGVYPTFVRLITKIGPAPGCALGNACCYGHGYGYSGYGAGYGAGQYTQGLVNTVGSVTDIPIDSIAAIVRNAV